MNHLRMLAVTCPSSIAPPSIWPIVRRRSRSNSAFVRLGVFVPKGQSKLAMLLRMFSATIRRVEKHGCRRIGAGERAVVAHIGPEPAGSGLALGQDRHCGVVRVDAFGRKDMAPDRVNQRHQGCGGGSHPICQRRYMKVDTFTLVDLALTLERQVQAVLGEQDMGSSFGPARPRAIVCEGAGG